MRILFLIGLTTLAFVTAAWCNEMEDSKRQSLKGIPGVYVLVEDIRPEIESVGLSVDGTKTKTELELRKAGIRVMTRQESFEAEMAPYLYVNINTLELDGRAEVCFSISISFNQKVTLSNGQKVYGSTWDRSTVGICGRDRVSSYVNENLLPLVELFANDFLAANPKKLSVLPETEIKPEPIAKLNPEEAEVGFSPIYAGPTWRREKVLLKEKAPQSAELTENIDAGRFVSTTFQLKSSR